MARPAIQARFPLAAAAAAAALALGCAAPAFAAGATYEVDKDFEVKVDGETIEGAKVFRGGRTGNLLLLVPAESKRFLLDARAGTVFALREEDAVVAANGATAKVRERFAWSVPLSGDRGSSRFLLGSSEVTVTRVEPKPETQAASEPLAEGTPDRAAPVNPVSKAPASGSARKSGSSSAERKPARECVSLETRPANGVPGCTRLVFLRNTCDAPVVAQLQRTEHLMTGSLPQLFSEVVPAGSELALGCSWWSGAMAPAQHQIVGASFLP